MLHILSPLVRQIREMASRIPKAAVVILYKISSGIDNFTRYLESWKKYLESRKKYLESKVLYTPSLLESYERATRALVPSDDASIFHRRPNFRVSMVRVQST